MAFADPQSVTVNAVAQSMPRTGISMTEGVFRKDDGTYTLRIQQREGNRPRRVIRLENRKIAADPLTSENTEYGMSAYLVLDLPKVGYTNAEAKLIIDGFLAYLTASSGAKITQLLGGEL